MIVGTGIDVIEITRVERALRRSGERFARRVFAASEILDCRSRRRSGPHFAMRFAAKEAVMKALGTGWAGGVRWVDIEIVSASSESPDRLSLRLHGRVAELAELGFNRIVFGLPSADADVVMPLLDRYATIGHALQG